MKEPLSERCIKASDYLHEKRKELLALEKEYRKMTAEQRSPLDLLDMKDRLISFSIKMTDVYTRTKQLHLEAQLETSNAYTLQYLKEREEIQENGKFQTVANAERNAKLKIADEYVTEHHSDINHVMARKIISDTQLLIDTCIQRVSIIKNETFNARQPNTI